MCYFRPGYLKQPFVGLVVICNSNVIPMVAFDYSAPNYSKTNSRFELEILKNKICYSLHTLQCQRRDFSSHEYKINS